MSTRAEFFQSMYPGLSDGEVIDELIKASIYGFEHGPEVVTISAAEGIHYVPYDAAMQKKSPYWEGTYKACNIPFTDFQIRYQPEQVRIVDGKRILEDRSSGRVGPAQCLRCQIRQVEHCRFAHPAGKVAVSGVCVYPKTVWHPAKAHAPPGCGQHREQLRCRVVRLGDSRERKKRPHLVKNQISKSLKELFK